MTTQKTELKKFDVKKLTDSVKQTTYIDTPMNMDSIMDSRDIKVSLISQDINGVMTLLSDIVSHTIRNLRMVFLPLNLDNFNIENIREKLNSETANKINSNIAQGLQFKTVTEFRIGFKSVAHNFSLGKFINSIVYQVKSNQNVIFLDIPTEWIKKDMRSAVVQLVIGLYISSLEINSNKKDKLLFVGKDRNSKIKANIQSALLNIGLILPTLEREYYQNNANGFLNLQKLESTLHFEDVYNPLIRQLNDSFKKSDLENKHYFREIKIKSEDDKPESDFKQFISIEKTNFNIDDQKLGVTHRRVKNELKDWLFGSFDNVKGDQIIVKNYNHDTSQIETDKNGDPKTVKMNRLLVKQIIGLPSNVVKAKENAFLVTLAKGESFTTVKKWFEDKATTDKPIKKDSLTKNEIDVKNNNNIKTSK